MTPDERKKIDEAFEAEYKKMPKGQWQNPFASAPVRTEGEPVYPDAPESPMVDTTWIEFPLPKAWKNECEAMIDNWLKAKIAATKINWEM